MGTIDLVVRAFQEWANEAGIDDSLSRVQVEDLGVPHRPTVLSAGRQGVYTFQLQSVWLKAGKAGPKSGARWQSQHYKAARSMSNLSWSLLEYAHRSTVDIPVLPPTLREQLRTVDPDQMGDWIKRTYSSRELVGQCFARWRRIDAIGIHCPRRTPTSVRRSVESMMSPSNH